MEVAGFSGYSFTVFGIVLTVIIPFTEADDSEYEDLEDLPNGIYTTLITSGSFFILMICCGLIRCCWNCRTMRGEGVSSWRSLQAQQSCNNVPTSTPAPADLQQRVTTTSSNEDPLSNRSSGRRSFLMTITSRAGLMCTRQFVVAGGQKLKQVQTEVPTPLTNETNGNAQQRSVSSTVMEGIDNPLYSPYMKGDRPPHNSEAMTP